MANKIKKVSAEWNAELNCTCPYCGAWENYFNEWYDGSMYESGGICKEADIDHADFIVECKECKREFQISDTLW